MSENKTECNISTGFISNLQLIFITLKLCGVITWDWLWVLSPALITGSVVLAILIVAFIYYLIVR